MDMALEVVSVTATAPGSSGAAGSAVTGNSLTIRDAVGAQLISMWGNRQTDGIFRLTSPLLHDNIVGISFQIDAADIAQSKMVCPQMLTPQDTLTATLSGSAVAGDIENNSFLVMYEGLAGIDGKLIDTDTLKKNAVELYDSSNAITADATGNYSGEALLNADEDQLKANMDYAIVGFTKNGGTGIATVRYVSPDWGNLGIGGPAFTEDLPRSSHFFADLSNEMGMPTIPVFNASQKSSVFISALVDENAGTFNITTHMVRLKPGTFGSKKRR